MLPFRAILVKAVYDHKIGQSLCFICCIISSTFPMQEQPDDGFPLLLQEFAAEQPIHFTPRLFALIIYVSAAANAARTINNITTSAILISFSFAFVSYN